MNLPEADREAVFRRKAKFPTLRVGSAAKAV